jgi:hypothetical protein
VAAKILSSYCRVGGGQISGEEPEISPEIPRQLELAGIRKIFNGEEVGLIDFDQHTRFFSSFGRMSCEKMTGGASFSFYERRFTADNGAPGFRKFDGSGGSTAGA